MLAPVLAGLILAGYAAALWWLLRRETVPILLLLSVLACLSLSLRLVYTTEFPPGLYEDEPNILESAMQSLRQGRLFGESSVVIPTLLSALFQGQLVPIFGPNRWAIRTYSLVTSVLATPAAFAVARALSLRVVPSMAAGALIAVVPPSLFYGRIHLGGELVFHELLLLAALAQLIWMNGRARDRWAALALGGFAQCLLLYDYWCGRTMMGMAVVAAVLARRGQRLLCLGILALALIGYIPYLHERPHNAISGVTDHLRPEFFQDPIGDLKQRVTVTVQALAYPVANDGWGTIQTAAMHPPLILALAALGLLLNPGRRGLFLLAGFLGGLAPAALSDGAPSAHRMLMAYAFIPLAAACAFDRIPWRLPRTGVALTAVLIIAIQSMVMYFSPDFWPADAREIFDWEKTAAVEALPDPPHPHFIVQRQVGFYFRPRGLVDPDFDLLSVENWFPTNQRSVLYVFEESAAPLRGFYDALLGPQCVQTFGRAFHVNIRGGDWAWLRQHGWMYEAHCGAQVWRGQVPTLFQPGLTFVNVLQCQQEVTHIWRGRWNGPAALARFKWNGVGVIETPRGRVDLPEKSEGLVDFNIDPDSPIIINVTVKTGDPMLGEFFQVTPAGERMPPWEWVSPVTADTAVQVDQQRAAPAS
jgi:hypothetical protein